MNSINSSERFVYIDTFGCQMNASDTQRLLAFLADDYSLTREPERADLIVLNTCTVRDKAEQKVYSAAGKFKPLKAKNKDLIFAICGCVAQQEGESLLRRIDYLDIVFGPGSIHRVKDMIDEVRNRKNRISNTTQSSIIEDGEYAQRAVEGSVKAFISIMRGCDNFCSYCIVPYTRGRETSRESNDIISEIEAHVRGGVKEVTLLGQNVNSYNAGGSTDFPALLRRVCMLEGLERVRFITSHPKDISDELIGLFAVLPNLARHIHLPMQSGSDKILKRMRRGYTSHKYLSKVDQLKRLYPDISITTDMIVGFPGETDEDFNSTMQVVDSALFDSIFSFKYSRRPGTPAEDFGDQVSGVVMAERLNILQKRQMEITMESNSALVGRAFSVLVEGTSARNPNELTGRSGANKIINFPGPASLIGKMADVVVTTAFQNSLRGDLKKRSLQ